MLALRSSFLASLLTAGVYASVTSYGGYEPVTVVTDHAGIAEDQKLIEQYVGKLDTFPFAQDIYANGGNSKSYALLTLNRALGATVSKGTSIRGEDANGNTVTGKAMNEYPSTANVIEFQYPTTNSNENYVSCRVGGLPSANQVSDLCLKSTGGSVTIAGVSGPFNYTSIENRNDRTLKGFSTNANVRMRPGDDLAKDFFPFFVPYVKYYGVPDFGDRIIQAGFSGSQTSGFDNGAVDLRGYGVDAQSQIVKKGTAYINALLYSQRELYDAVHDCEEECDVDDCNDDAVHALDEAVAFYAGNQINVDGMGNLGYSLAEKRCRDFATCTGDRDQDPREGMSYVNSRLMTEFNSAKSKFASGDCKGAASVVQEIVRLQQIPLVQGTLRYAERTSSFAAPTQTMQAEGAIFAAAILPKVHACSNDQNKASQVIYDNMRLKNGGGTKADFKAVKDAFESVYACMQVTCEEIGGVVDVSTGDSYVQGGQPCGGVSAFGSSGIIRSTWSSITVAVGAMAAVLTLLN